MTEDEAFKELERWKPLVRSEMERHQEIRFTEEPKDFQYFRKLGGESFIFRMNEDVLIIGAVTALSADETIQNRFSPRLFISEVENKPRNGHGHHVAFESRASGIPSAKALVKNAMRRAGIAEKKVRKPLEAKAQIPAGRGYLIQPIPGTDDVHLHVGMARVSAETAERIVELLNSQCNTAS